MLTGKAHCLPHRELLPALSSHGEAEGWQRRLAWRAQALVVYVGGDGGGRE